MGILAIIERWFNRHDAAVLEALSSGPKNGEELKAAGVLGATCTAILHDMEKRGLIESEIQDPKPGKRFGYRIYWAVGTSEDSC